MNREPFRPFVCALALCLSSSAAFAEPVADALPVSEYPAPASAPSDGNAAPQSAPVATRAHDGFYASVEFGGGARSLSVHGSEDVVIDGNGVAMGLRIGGAVMPNLILHGGLFGASTEDPEISIDALTVVADDARLTFASIGPGVTYYFMPADVYVGGSLLVAQTRLEFEGDELTKSEWGPGVELRLGKAFWIAPHTRLGVGLQGFAANMSDQNTTDTLKARAANLVVDVTYD